MSETMTPPRPKGPPKPKGPPQRKVLYPDYRAEIRAREHALKPEDSKALIGWCTDESVALQHGLTEPAFIDLNRQKVWLLNNIRNRPLYMENVEGLIQEHLNRKWRFNFEPIIIGKTGIVENGQHQFVSHILAEQHRLLDGEGRQWAALWPGPVTMAKLVCYGLDEDDDTINTMDTARPRSFTDVIYRSQLFGAMKGGDLKNASRMLDSCVRLLWDRTGAKVDAFAPRRTHSEGMGFIRRHPRTVRCVKHIFEEFHGIPKDSSHTESERWVLNNRRIGAGYAAALCYLMGSSLSDPAGYAQMRHPGEEPEKVGKSGKVGGLNWDRWDQAIEFWTLFAKEDPKLGDTFRSLGYLVDPDTGAGGTLAERLSIINKAWHLFSQGKVIKVKDVEPTYVENEAGVRRVKSPPLLGGIDRGGAALNSPDVVPADDLPGAGPADPTHEDIEAEKEKIKQEKLEKKKASGKKKPDEDDVNGEPEQPAAPKRKPPKPLAQPPAAQP